MFEKWFAKYARAVSDERERQWLYNKYKTKTIISIIFYCLCAAVIVLALALGSDLDSNWKLMLFFLVFLAWIGFAIADLCLWLSFRKAYNAILKRPAYTGEMPEVTSYRQKTVQDKKSTFKKLWWAWLIFGLGVVGFIVCLALEFIKNPDGEEFTIWGNAAIISLFIGALVIAFAYIFINSIKQQQGKAVEQQTAAETAAIDKAQGRKNEYKLQNDPNLNTYKYMFPNKELYEQAESLRVKYSKKVTIGIITAVIVTAIVVIALYAANVFNQSTEGYALPTALTVVYLVMFLFILIPRQRRELNALEKKQKAELKDNPDYAKNLEWYKLNDDFYKVKGRLINIFYVVGVGLGWVLAVILPDTLWSLTSLAVIFIGLIINNSLVKNLRLNARPIEHDIDELLQKPKRFVRFTYKEDEEPRHMQVYHDLKVKYVGTCFVTKDGGGDCTLYTGINSIDFDIESNRVGGISGDILCDLLDIENREIQPPEDFKDVILYVDNEENFKPGICYNFDMPQKMYYDKNSHILQLGECDYTKPYLRFLNNAYAQLDESGYLKGIIVTDIKE